jgi:hypothetical protein
MVNKGFISADYLLIIKITISAKTVEVLRWVAALDIQWHTLYFFK